MIVFNTFVYVVFMCMFVSLGVLSQHLSEGNKAYRAALELYEQTIYDEAAVHFWQSIMSHSTEDDYTLQEAFAAFLNCYSTRGILDEGFVFIGDEYTSRKEIQNGLNFYERAVQANPKNAKAYMKLAQVTNRDSDEGKEKYYNLLVKALEIDPNDAEINQTMGNFYYEIKHLLKAIDYMDRAYSLDNNLVDAAANAIHIRFSICAWGTDGVNYKKDLEMLKKIAQKDSETCHDLNATEFKISPIHPHMTLAYPINSTQKLEITRSFSRAEQRLLIKSGLNSFNDTSPRKRSKFLKESRKPGFRVKVGYVSANIKSKTTVYMAQDLMRFHDRSKFEVHVFATTPPDTPMFLDGAMRGVDWRKKIKNSVEHFHDLSGKDIIEMSAVIRDLGMHILLDWDGYSNQGVRAMGLFALQTAPIQIAHQEYIGTMGADYIQYLITDQIASPVEYSHNYAEKFLYMPHSFLANSFSYQGPDMSLPQLQLPKNDNPSHNRCDLPLDEGKDSEGNGRDGKFVYCNFNKHLKFDPDLFTHWLQTMKTVKNSYLCLLENPEESKENLWGFASDVDPDLADRIGFLPFIGNPYDNQRRNARYCSAILDTTVYNGHTTAADALWGGVPVVTRGDGMDMGSRVGASALTALGIKELIAHTQDEYDQIAVRLATDSTFYTEVRTKLIQANLASSPRNPFWDLERYVRNLESGLASVWKTFIDGGEMQHVYITDRGSLRSAEREVAFPIVFRNETDMADIDEDDDEEEEEEETELQTSFEVVDEKKGGSKSRREGGETRRRKRDENSPKKRRRKGVNRQRRRRREKRRKHDQSDEL